MFSKIVVRNVDVNKRIDVAYFYIWLFYGLLCTI